MDKPSLFRRRYIPDELIHLKDDEVILYDNEIIVTKWKVLKPRTDFTNGFSCYYLKKGFKISKFYNKSELLYTYCDIIEPEFHNENKIIINDLLIDVVIENNGFVKIIDLDEIPIAMDKGIISINSVKKALTITNELLSLIYSGQLNELLKPISEII